MNVQWYGDVTPDGDASVWGEAGIGTVEWLLGVNTVVLDGDEELGDEAGAVLPGSSHTQPAAWPDSAAC